jgi:hypothetical protein
LSKHVTAVATDLRSARTPERRRVLHGGASSRAWSTFFHGDTAALIQNSFPFTVGDGKPAHILQNAFNAALATP